MQDEIQVFNNEKFGRIRAISIDGEPWFIGTEVATDLGYTNPRKAIRDHVNPSDRNTVTIRSGIRGNPNKIVVNESGVYSLVLYSQLPAAKKFKHWITSEVIPCIRKHGAYATLPTLEKMIANPESIVAMAKQLMLETEKSKALSAELETVKPKAEYYDAFVNERDYTNIRATAKELQIPERMFISFLLNDGFLFRQKSGSLLPYAKLRNEGLFVVRDFMTEHGHFGQQTLFTPKGKDTVRKRWLKEYGNAVV